MEKIFLTVKYINEMERNYIIGQDGVVDIKRNDAHIRIKMEDDGRKYEIIIPMTSVLYYQTNNL